MQAYWILYSIIAFFFIFEFIKLPINPSFKKYLLFAVIIGLALFAGIRFDSDNDYAEYLRIYNEAPTLTEIIEGSAKLTDIYGEYGFILLVVVCKTLAMPPYLFFTTMAILTLLFLYKSILYFSNPKDYFTHLFLYVSFFYLGGVFTQIRFGLSCTLACFGLATYYRDSKSLRCIFYLTIACLFHVSAISALIFFFLKKFIRLKASFVYIALAFAIIFSSLSFNNIVLDLVSSLLGSKTRYDSYLDQATYTNRGNSFAIYFYSVVIFIFWHFRERFLDGIEQKKYEFLIRLGLFALVASSIFNQVFILTRFSIVLQIPFIFILPLVFGLKPFRPIGYILLFAYCTFRFSQYFSKEGFIQEYKTYFDTK